MDDSDDGDNENEDHNDNVAADTKEEEVVVAQNGRYLEVVETLQLVLLFLFQDSVCGDDVWMMMVVHHHVVQLMEKPYPDYCRHCYYVLYKSRNRVVVMDLAVLHVPATLDRCRQASLIDCLTADDPPTACSYRSPPQHSMMR